MSELCSAAESITEGYWTCDVMGGCSDCRELAEDIEDYGMIEQWNEERKQAKK